MARVRVLEMKFEARASFFELASKAAGAVKAASTLKRDKQGLCYVGQGGAPSIFLQAKFI